jgi:hypothetical protein
MTPQERQLLESFLDRIANTPSPQRDPEADALIREKIGSRPDALYILTQTALIEDIALRQANARIQELQQQLQSQGAPQQTSFLGRLFGTGPTSQPSQPPPPPQTQYAPPPPQYGQPQYGPPQGYAPGPQAGGGSSFLRSAAITATGVAAGALAFEGIESLLHPHGFGGGLGEGSGFLGGAPNETIINNYYDSPSDDRGDALANADYTTGDDSDDSYDSTDVSDDDSSFDDSGSDDYNV